MKPKIIYSLFGVCLAANVAPALAVVMVNQTTDSNALANALGGSGLTINSATVQNGVDAQFGTYSNFNAGPVTFSDGVVLSDGNAVDVSGPASEFGEPDTNLDVSGTPEFDSYGPGRINNFTDSHDVAALNVDFTLASESQIAFDFIFGSVEYPDYVNDFTDGFVAFLDGTDAADQIVFDKNGNPVQVGSSFSSQLTKDDVNTAFGAPHGLLTSLTTLSPVLSAGSHSLLFELGDTNDHALDSAVFLANLRTGEGDVGTGGSDDGGTGGPGQDVPAPGALTMLGLGLFLIAGACGYRRYG